MLSSLMNTDAYFYFFLRARANGFIPENPVAQAVREGRFEELPDDAEDLD